jgi:perosamine synthetase
MDIYRIEPLVKVTRMQIPMSGPSITSEEVGAVNQVLRTPVLSIGPQIELFEHKVAEFVGSRHAACVSSGTAGLHLCVLAAGLTEGDLCITTPFSFVASSNCLLYERVIPVFVDIDPVSLNIDPQQVLEAAEALKSSVSEGAKFLPPAIRGAHPSRLHHRLKALLPVHVFGQPADMDPLLQVAHKHELVVIEDACEALGAAYKGLPAGTLGDVGVFAFYPNKQITVGEGGIIVTNRKDWDSLFRSLRNQGRDGLDSWLEHSRLGYNYRLNEMSAALGVVQMQRIEELLSRREQIAQMYNERLKDAEGVSIPCVTSNTTRMSWFVYVIRLAQDVDRATVMAYLEEHGVPSRVYFSPIHLQPYYRRLFGYREGDFPVTEMVARSALALPFSSVMNEDEVDWVCTRLGEAVRRARKKGERQKSSETAP